MKPGKKYKFFSIHENDLGSGGKMEYVIISRSQGLRLGDIAWYAPWRKWCFFPGKFAETVWSDGCLRDVLDFMGGLK